MAGKIPQGFIDDLLARSDIVELIEQYVPLKKKGRDHMACCPFHSEKTPSFSVSADKQFYHCFGCGAHGTAISFLMEHERLHFVDAIELLAERAGLEVPREGGEAAEAPRFDHLYALMEEVARHFREQLREHPAAVDYLKRRGLSGTTAKDFGIGYAPPGWDNLLKRFRGREADLDACGLLSHNQQGRVYDRFRERIVFPIRDARGRSVGFGGRVIGDGEPKYLNSPETALFHKGRELYGLFEARRAERKLSRLLVVEGYMDAVMLAEHGLRNAVATLGTATTSEHLDKLFRACRDVIFCFDGDRAGRQAAWRALHNALPTLRDGREIRFLFLPEGEDPDSLVRQRGRDAFAALLDAAVPLADYLFAELQRDSDGSIGARARLAEQARPLIAQLPEGTYRELLGQRLDQLVGLHAAPPTPRAAPRRGLPQRPRGTAMTPMRQAICILLQQPAAALALAAELEIDATRPGGALLAELLATIRAQPQISSAQLIERFRQREEWPIVNRLAGWALPDGRSYAEEGARRELPEVIERIQRAAARQRLRELTRSAKPDLAELRRLRELLAGGEEE